jgi:hypothetical protein
MLQGRFYVCTLNFSPGEPEGREERKKKNKTMAKDGEKGDD